MKGNDRCYRQKKNGDIAQGRDEKDPLWYIEKKTERRKLQHHIAGPTCQRLRFSIGHCAASVLASVTKLCTFAVNPKQPHAAPLEKKRATFAGKKVSLDIPLIYEGYTT